MMKTKQMKRAGCLLLAALLLTGCAVPSDGGEYEIAAAVYPEMAEYPGDEALTGHEKRYDAWRESADRLHNQPDGYKDGMADYCTAVIRQFMTGTDGENRVFSPLSLYSALAMTAETAAGNSRDQILALLGDSDIEELRQKAKSVWEANYTDDGATVSISANSLWLSDGVKYNGETLQTLAENYYASSFRGEMGSDGYSEAMRNWLNEQTGGLLTDAAESERTDENTVLALFSAMRFSARWMGEFREENTQSGVFHGAKGDENAQFMKMEEIEDDYYWADDFAAYFMDLENTGGVWFVLPDEDASPDDVLAGDNFYRLIFTKVNAAEPEWENRTFIKINLSVPKFRAESEIDLTEGLSALGVTDIFSAEDADFSPLTVDFADPVWIDQAEQNAALEIDEEGITAAAYTKMRYYGAPPPPDEVVDFVCDRPFIAVVLGNDDLPVFTCVVNTVN